MASLKLSRLAALSTSGRILRYVALSFQLTMKPVIPAALACSICQLMTAGSALL